MEAGPQMNQLRNVGRGIGLMLRPSSEANPMLDALMANLSSALDRLDTQPDADDPVNGPDEGDQNGSN